MWQLVALWAVTLVIGFVLQPKPRSSPPPGRGEIKAPTVDPGREIPVIFGTVDIRGPMVVWYGDIQYVPIKR